MNLVEGGSHCLPLRVSHRWIPARMPIDKGVQDHRPLPYRGPQCITLRGKGSNDCCDPLIPEVARNQAPWFVECSILGFEQIGAALLAHDAIQPGPGVIAQRQKLKRDGCEAILVLETGAQVFLWNARFFTH